MAAYVQDNFFQLLDIKCADSGERVMNSLFSYLAYLEVGDTYETPYFLIEKLNDDLLHFSVKINNDEMINALESKQILKFT